MWIALTVPGMVLGCIIAIVPVLYGSIRDCRTEAALRLEVPLLPVIDSTEAPAETLEIVCPPCGAVLSGTDSGELLVAINHHAWHVHGVPQSGHALREAVPATV
ncbi:MAG: hypothetical protein ACLQK4_10140 [Acidimicrobiales bacterium]|jgi:hypothetical protein